MRFKEINGLLWAMENLEILPSDHEGITMVDGVQYFTKERAEDTARERGLRLPTADEAEALLAAITGGEPFDAFDPDEAAKPLAFAFDGGLGENDKLYHKGYSFQFWTSSLSSSNPFTGVSFFVCKANPGSWIQAYGLNGEMRHGAKFPLRCVKDIS